MIKVVEATTKKEMKKFIMFPFELYKNDKNWVPPLIFDEWNTFSRKKNPSFEHCEAAYLLAYNETKVVGRITAIINHKANERWHNKLTRFGWISFIDDMEVSKALLDAAQAWGEGKGMKGIHGPLGFSDLDPEGMLVEGYQNQPSITSAYNFPYFPEHMVKHGFSKSVDWVQYKFNASQPVPEKVARINNLISQKYHLTTLVPKTKKALIPIVPKFFRTLNDAFKNLYGFTELSEKQIKYYTDAYFGFAVPELLCFILDEKEEVVGFGIIFPSLSTAFQKAKGRLFPFGFIHILKALRNYHTIDLYFNGVHPDWQKRGIHTLYYSAMSEIAIKKNLKFAISTGQLETNINAVGIWDNYEKEPYFRTRCYIKN
jgi:ribosomal protein S18 acetylase RimI-like enzyme